MSTSDDDNNREDEDTEFMSELLLKGATMLAHHCEDCGNPMFRYRGDVFCPVCNRDEARQKKKSAESQMRENLNDESSDEMFRQEDDQESEPVKENEPRTREPSPESGSENRTQSPTANQEVVASLSKLVARLARELEDEEDLKRANEKLDTLERTLDIIERLN